jgi:hypothetical protein
MSADDELDRLYQMPLGEFVTARNQLAASVKKTGDADAANQIKAIPKPSASAWAVNQVYWKERWVFDALMSASDRLRAAIEAGTADALGGDREETVRVAIGRARRFLEESGEKASDAVMRRVTTTFDALASYGSSNPNPLRGRLSQDLQPAGFGAFAGVAPPPPAAPPSASPPSPAPFDNTELLELEAMVDRARRELAEATAAAASLRDELKMTQRRCLAAEEAAQAAAEKLSERQVALDDARRQTDPS